LLPRDLDREGARLGLDGEELLATGLLLGQGTDAEPREEPDRPEEDSADDRAATGPAERRPAVELGAVLDADLTDLGEVHGAVLPGARVAEHAARERQGPALALELPLGSPGRPRGAFGRRRVLLATLGDRRFEFGGAL